MKTETMNTTEHAIRRLAEEKGWFVLPLPNDIWDFSRGDVTKTLYCKARALEWIEMQ